MKKPQTQDINVMTREGQFKTVKGIKKPNGKLLIDNPFYQRRIKQIERKPDS